MSGQLLFKASDIDTWLASVASSICQFYPALDTVALVGIMSSGWPIAKRLQQLILTQSGQDLPLGKLDVTLYRDDLAKKDNYVTLQETDIPFNIENRHLVLVDDVLFHGRTIRAALNALSEHGRTLSIQLAVLLDRGHRELPIFSQFIGHTLDTNYADHLQFRLLEVDGEDGVYLTESTSN